MRRSFQSSVGKLHVRKTRVRRWSFDLCVGEFHPLLAKEIRAACLDYIQFSLDFRQRGLTDRRERDGIAAGGRKLPTTEDADLLILCWVREELNEPSGRLRLSRHHGHGKGRQSER